MYFQDGDFKQTRIIIVWGPPAAGKSTYIREHATEEDVIVDLDKIKQAICVFPKSEAPDQLLQTCLLLKETLINEIKNNRVYAKTAYIAEGLPREKDRKKYLDMGVKMVGIIPPKEECIKRAMLDDERINKNHQIQIIEKWFSIYSNHCDN